MLREFNSIATLTPRQQLHQYDCWLGEPTAVIVQRSHQDPRRRLVSVAVHSLAFAPSHRSNNLTARLHSSRSKSPVTPSCLARLKSCSLAASMT